MKFEEAIKEILGEAKKVKEPKVTIKVDDYNQNYPGDKKEVKSKFPGVVLVRINGMGDQKVFKGEREALLKMVISQENITEIQAIMFHPELKSLKQEQTEKWIESTLEDYKKYYDNDHYLIAKKIIYDNKLGYDEMYKWEMKKLKVKEVDSKESISIRNRASVSTHTIEGEIKILGKTYKAEVLVFDDVHGI